MPTECRAAWARVIVGGVFALVVTSSSACSTSTTTTRETLREHRTIDGEALDIVSRSARVWDQVVVNRRAAHAATFQKVRVGQLTGSVIVFSPWSDRILDSFPLEEVRSVEVSAAKTSTR